jgi:hypothetical protein
VDVTTVPDAATRRAVAVDPDALEVARQVIEDFLIEMRDCRTFILGGNGFTVREKDGSESSIMRLSTRDGLQMGIQAYLAALGRTS